MNIEQKPLKKYNDIFGMFSIRTKGFTEISIVSDLFPDKSQIPTQGKHGLVIVTEEKQKEE